MPMQQTNSSFAKKLGARVAQANAEHKDKPIDHGQRRLPAGIKQGIAKLQFMYTKEQDKDDGMVPKGENFFRASAVSLGKIVNGHLVKEHEGINIEGITTAVIIPLCDVPAKGNRKERTFSQNWFDFQNLFKLLSNGSIVCPETPQSDPTGQKTEAFYFAAMQALTNPKHPIYVEFSTRGWIPPATAQKPKPDEMVFEEWHGLATLPSNDQFNPAAGVTEAPPLPPAPSTGNGVPTQHHQGSGSVQDEKELVAELVAILTSDPELSSPDASEAAMQLETLAWARGWTKEQTGEAKDWAEVGRMALNAPQTPTAGDNLAAASVPAVGSRFMYAKRTKDGVRYKDNKGAEFPPQECEVTSVDAEAKTVTLKTVHDGKDVVDLRTKKPVDVKFEWLENAPPY